MKRFMILFFSLFLVFAVIGTGDAVMKRQADKMAHGGMMGGDMGCGCMGMGMMGDPGHILRNAKFLGLDAKQKTAIGEIVLKARKETIKKMADLEIARLDLKEIVKKDLIDMDAAKAKIKQIEAIKSDMMLAHIADLEKIRNVLTPEQREKFNELMEMPMMGMGGMMGRGMMDNMPMMDMGNQP